MSQFDPAQFLDMTFTEATDTKLTPIPEGEYQAQIVELKSRMWSDKNDSSAAARLVIDVVWQIEDQDLKTLLEREKITVKQGLFLDLSPTGGIAMGKGQNVQLGRLREALGQNKPGQVWSPQMLNGQFATIRVSQRIVGEDIFNDVKGVAPLA